MATRRITTKGYLQAHYCHYSYFCVLVTLIVIVCFSSVINASKQKEALPLPPHMKISCSNDEEMMIIDFMDHERNLMDAYIKGLKNYPEPSCLPNRVGDNLLQFRLSLIEFSRCGTSQIVNQLTGSITYYNRIILITKDKKDTEVLVKCKKINEFQDFPEDNKLNATSRRRRRDVLPAGFEEQNPIFGVDQIGYGPEPILSMVVKQEGRVIGEELLVQPGAPLMMEVSHIERPIGQSTRVEDVYGIIVSRLDVTDTLDQGEVIIVNACSVDPYLFENFQTADGDTLTAKFRAFKFPDSSYVLFKSTVNVCLGKCEPTQCSNGQIGYGRRRRRSLMNKNMNETRDNEDGSGLLRYVLQLNAILRIDDSKMAMLDDGTILLSSRRHKRLNENEGSSDKLGFLPFGLSKASSSSGIDGFRTTVVTIFVSLVTVMMR